MKWSIVNCQWSIINDLPNRLQLTAYSLQPTAYSPIQEKSIEKHPLTLQLFNSHPNLKEIIYEQAIYIP